MSSVLEKRFLLIKYNHKAEDIDPQFPGKVGDLRG